MSHHKTPWDILRHHETFGEKRPWDPARIWTWVFWMPVRCTYQLSHWSFGIGGYIHWHSSILRLNLVVLALLCMVSAEVTKYRGTSFWDIMSHHRTPWLILRPHEPFWDIMSHFETSWDILRHNETYWDTMNHHETFWDIMSHHRTPWVITMRHFVTPWDILRHHEPPWDTMRHFETSWAIIGHHEYILGMY